MGRDAWGALQHEIDDASHGSPPTHTPGSPVWRMNPRSRSGRDFTSISSSTKNRTVHPPTTPSCASCVLARGWVASSTSTAAARTLGFGSSARRTARSNLASGAGHGPVGSPGRAGPPCGEGRYCRFSASWCGPLYWSSSATSLSASCTAARATAPVKARSSCPCRTAVDSSLTGHAPFAADDDRCASVSRVGGGDLQNIRLGAIPRGGCRRGKREEARRRPAAAPEPNHRRGGPVRQPTDFAESSLKENAHAQERGNRRLRDGGRAEPIVAQGRGPGRHRPLASLGPKHNRSASAGKWANPKSKAREGLGKTNR